MLRTPPSLDIKQYQFFQKEEITEFELTQVTRTELLTTTELS